jgi:hypothetical protein
LEDTAVIISEFGSVALAGAQARCRPCQSSVSVVRDLEPDEILRQFAAGEPACLTSGRSNLMLDLAISGGTCVLPSGTQAADIGVKDGRIVLVGGPGTLPQAVRSVSAANHLVIPGGIDPHIHCGLEWKVSGQPVVHTDPAAQVSRRPCTAAPRP